MDAIGGIYSTAVSLQQLQKALSQLTAYARQYRLRLKGQNRIYITQVIRLLSSIIDCLQTVTEKEKNVEGLVHPSDLMSGKGVDQINTHKLSRYLTESKLARKVEGFSDHIDKKHRKDQKTLLVAPVLFQVQSFMLSLMNPSKEGKFFYSKSDGQLELKYVLLDPTSHFREITEDAKAVILAGGTMSPVC
jgi:chromosome transmission fidelity protein 1